MNKKKKSFDFEDLDNGAKTGVKTKRTKAKAAKNINKDRQGSAKPRDMPHFDPNKQGGN